MNQTHTIIISEGQTLLLYKGDKIILRKKHDCKSSVTTSWQSFVGTDEEVNEKIKILSLSEIERPNKKKKEEEKGVVIESKKQPISTRLLNFFKAIFSK